MAGDDDRNSISMEQYDQQELQPPQQELQQQPPPQQELQQQQQQQIYPSINDLDSSRNNSPQAPHYTSKNSFNNNSISNQSLEKIQEMESKKELAYEHLSPAPESSSYEDLGLKDQVLENVFGATVRQKKARVPEGFIVSYTKSGQPFLLSVELQRETNEDFMAANEHAKLKLPINCDNKDIERVYGTGIYLYFNFISFCIGVNVLLFLCVLINMVPHYYFGAKYGHFKNFSIQDYLLLSLNLQSYYQSEVKLYYFWSTFGCILLSFFMGPVYAFKINSYFRKSNKTDFEDGFDADDVIVKNANIPRKERLVRFFISYIIFILLLGGSAVLCALVLKFVNSYKFFTNILTTSFISACIIRVINVIYDQISIYLTMFEKHPTWTKFKIQNTLKLFVFKIVNVIILYILRDRIFENITHQSILEGCPFVDVGSQFLFILVLDLTLSNLWEIIYSVSMAYIGRRREKSGRRSTESYKPEFEISEEYLEILYRQFIVYLGLPIYPIVALFGVVCNIVEYYVDRFRLIRICKKPHRMQGSMKKFLSFYLLFISLISVASYPYGSGWVLIQIGFKTGNLNTNCGYLFDGDIPVSDSSSSSTGNGIGIKI
ncbi:hypothetical protein ACTFIW_010806 [Dictyostelium discoideum]